MGILEDYRKQFPQYDKIPDDQLEDALYKKYYADKMPRKEFYEKIAVKDVTKEVSGDDLAYRSTILPLGKDKSGNIVPAVPGAIKSLIDLPQQFIQAGQAGPPGSRELTEAAIAPAAESAAAFGPGAAASRVGRFATKPAIETTQELKAGATAAYKASKEAGVEIKPEPFREMFSSVASAVKPAGFDKTLHPGSAAAIGRLLDEVQRGASPSLEELDTLRKIAGAAAKSQNADDRRMARLITEKMDDFLDNLTEKDVFGGDTKQGVESLKQARELWHRQAKSDQIDEMFEKAANRAPGTPALGFEGQLRNQFKALADNKNRLRRFTAEEQDAIKQVARGGKLQNAMSALGKFSPTSGFFASALSGAIGGTVLARLASGDVTALTELGVPTAGVIAKYVAGKMREAKANKVKDLVRGGKEAAAYFKEKQKLNRQSGQGRAGLLGAGGLSGATQITIPLDPNNVQ